jgi:hypothetical protein
MIRLFQHNAIFICITLAVLHIGCNPDKKEPTDNCNTYRLRYITDVRYDGGQAFTNRFSIGYEDDGKLITRYTIFNSDTFPSDYVKLNSNGQPIEYGNVPYPGSPTQRNDYFYQSDRVVEMQYWSSISPGASIMLAQTSTFVYTNDLLSKVENFEPNNPSPGSQMVVIYETDPKAKTYLYTGLPSQQIFQEDRYHFTNLVNPLAVLEIGFAWGFHEFLPDTISSRVIDGTYKNQIFEYETEDNRVVRAKTYQMGPPMELKRDVVYEYECY